MVKNFWHIIVSIVALDQITKALVATYTPNISLLPFFSLVTVKNYGAGFGILQGQQYILIAISLLVLAGIVYFRKSIAKEDHLAFALITGGLIGNLIDRIFRRYVIDFFDFFIGTYHWPAFNVADIALVVGVALLIINEIRKKK